MLPARSRFALGCTTPCSNSLLCLSSHPANLSEPQLPACSLLQEAGAAVPLKSTSSFLPLADTTPFFKWKWV